MILIRHGQTLFNLLFGATRTDPGLIDPRLTPAGRAQAAESAEVLRRHGVTRLVASPYTRALETAHIIAARLDVAVTVDARVRERCAFVCDIGTVRSALVRTWSHFDFAPFGEQWWEDEEEPEHRVAARTAAFCRDAASDAHWATTAVITHWGVIRALTGQRVKNAEVVRFDPRRVADGEGDGDGP